MSDCVTLWVGEEMGAVERACLRSVLRQGHSLALYCYDQPPAVPEGVELRDANAVLPWNCFFLGTRQSVTPFSDWFRYELQRRGAGIWVDTDMYLVRPLDTTAERLFGLEQPRLINNAVLRLPAGSRLLNALLQMFEARRTPPGLDWRDSLKSRARQLVRGAVDFERLPWGATGPAAISALARKFGDVDAALPIDAFYPVPWEDAAWIRDPDDSLERRVTERTIGIHLWNECIKPFKELVAPAGSFLGRLQREGGP